MKIPLVKEFMVPLEEYATVSEDATLKEAVGALEKAQERFTETRYPHRAVLVLNKANQLSTLETMQQNIKLKNV